MNNSIPTLVSLLVSIGKIDANLAHIAAEERKCRASLDERALKLKKIDEEIRKNDALIKERRLNYQKEEKFLRDEQSKLIDRRKALASFPSYKLQQAAEREIENTSRDLSAREETLLTTLEELESLEKQYSEKFSAADTERDDLNQAAKEFEEMKTGFDERRRRQGEERAALVPQVDPASMKLYDRVHDKYMMDPVIPLKGNTCSGCFMQVNPQVIITLKKGDALVRCPGCGRIVYLAE